jgi:3-oxoacyl-[acyl-carrier protein] reductase
MNLKLDNQWFLVCGAGSGFGRAVAERLLEEGAGVIAIARTASVLKEFEEVNVHKNRLITFCADITKHESHEQLMPVIERVSLAGIFVNAGGPPAKPALETTIDDWDEAYRLLVRWKIQLVMRLLPLFRKQSYGRIVFLESVSVKQPVENLVLSNSMRLAVIGWAKTLSQEIASEHIHLNVLAPGYHNTAAMQRLFAKTSANKGISSEEAKEFYEKKIPVGRLGQSAELSTLAVWLLSPLSGFVTGQTISHDGGSVSGLFG